MIGSMLGTTEASFETKSLDVWEQRSLNTSFSGRRVGGNRGCRAAWACVLSVVRRLLLCVAALALPVLSTWHMVLLDLELYNDGGPRVFSWLWAFILPELCLVLHMLRNAFSESEILVGSLQWISYSWLVAGKYCIIIFSTVPQLSSNSAGQVFDYVFFSPVIYCILCWKALQKLRTVEAQDRGAGGQALADRRAEETLDCMLFQDMIWHVVIDMIDIQMMMRLTSPGLLESASSEVSAGAERWGLLSEMAKFVERDPETAERIQTVAGVFVFLGLFFHQQSFPSVAYSSSSAGADHFRKRGPARATPPRTTHHSGSSFEKVVRMSTVVLRPTQIMRQLGGRTSVAESESSVQTSSTAGGSVQADAAKAAADEKVYRRHRGHTYKVDVVKARKRSIIVSILLVDVPFFAVRTSVYGMVLMSPRADEDSASTSVVLEDVNATVLEDVNTTTEDVNTTLEDGNITSMKDDNTTITATTTTITTITQTTAASGLLFSSELPAPDIWWFKNIVFMVVQAMQLRFVQQADLERSRDLVLLTKSAVGAGGKRKMKRTHDESLKRVWKSIDQERTAAQPHDLAGSEALGAPDAACPTAAAQAEMLPELGPARRGSTRSATTAARGTVGAFAPEAPDDQCPGESSGSSRASGRWRPTAIRASAAPAGGARQSRRDSADSTPSTEHRAGEQRRVRGKPKLRPMATIMSVGSTYTRSTVGLSMSRGSRPAELDLDEEQDEEQEERCACARRCAGRLCCCCRRRSQGGARCFCFTCDCSLWVLLHCLVGLVLGWFVAKVDFHQVLSESVVLSQAQANVL